MYAASDDVPCSVVKKRLGNARAKANKAAKKEAVDAKASVAALREDVGLTEATTKRKEGAPIPDGRGGFIKQNGRVVLSKLDDSALKELALTTDGTYVPSVAGDLDLRTIYLEDIKGTLEARELASSRERREEDRFQWALLPALLLRLPRSSSSCWAGGAIRRRLPPS